MLGRFLRGRWKSNILLFSSICMLFLYYSIVYRRIEPMQVVDMGKIYLEKYLNYTDDSKINLLDNVVHQSIKEVVHENECVSEFDVANHDLLTSDLWKKAWSKTLPSAAQLNNQLKVHTNTTLKVFVIVHSHVDPGWLKKFDEYYSGEVVQILDNMLKFMTRHPKMRYIWSEISFLEKWWVGLDDTRKSDLKKLILNGQLEITGGPWVMTDEATTHYWASVDNLIEGHDFLFNQLHIRPNVSWTVDPFGHGATVPYLLSMTNIKHHVIGRLFSDFKTWFRESQNLLVQWRQMWGKTCTAEDLSSSYKALSKFYRDPVVMVPHGSDFGLPLIQDWMDVHDSYEAIFKQMKQYGVEAQFGTVSDYFTALNHYRKDSNANPLSILAGDFFPYVSGPLNKNHWTGFYSTRPFYKRRERELESHIRSADILAAQATKAMPMKDKPMFMEWVYQSLKLPRRDLALFQHHDAITGTSKQHVMDDYALRLMKAWKAVDLVQSTCVSILTMHKLGDLNIDNLKDLAAHWTQVVYLNSQLNNMAQKTILMKNETARYLAIENSLPHSRKIIQRLIVDSPFVSVWFDGNQLSVQINPVVNQGRLSSQIFEIIFVALLSPLAVSIFELKAESALNRQTMNYAEVFVDTGSNEKFSGNEHHKVQETNNFFISNDYKVSTSHNKNGFIQTLSLDGNVHKLVHSVGTLDSTSGAYLISFNSFKQSDLKNFHFDNGQAIFVWKTEGPLISEINLESALLNISYTIVNLPEAEFKGVFLNAAPSLNDKSNRYGRSAIELLSTFKTHVSSSTNQQTIFTDSNCLHLTRREILDSVPQSAKFYPVTCAALLESNEDRFTILTGQPHAVTSLNDGEMNVIIDRIGYRDEGLGLPEGVTFSPPSHQHFFLSFEKKTKIDRNSSKTEENEFTYLSRALHLTLQSLLNLPVAFVNERHGTELPLQPLKSVLLPPPCDFVLLSCRIVAGAKFLVILQRVNKACVLLSPNMQFSCSHVDHPMFFQSLFTTLNSPDVIEETSLTGTFRVADTDIRAITLNPNQIRSFKFGFQ